MTDCGYEKNLDKLSSSELKKEIKALWERLEQKDGKISQLEETVKKLMMDSVDDEDEALEIRKKASDALKNALEEADEIIRGAKASAAKIIGHAKVVRETVVKEEKISELALPGADELFVSSDLLKTGGSADAAKRIPGSSFAEYFVEKEETAEEPPEAENTEQARTCGSHVFEQYVNTHDVVIPSRTAVQSDDAAEQACCKSHVFNEYVEAHNVVIPPRVADVPEVALTAERSWGSHVFDEYVEAHNVVIPPRTADVPKFSASADDYCGCKKHVLGEFSAPKNGTAEASANTGGWRELVDSLHK